MVDPTLEHWFTALRWGRHMRDGSAAPCGRCARIFHACALQTLCRGFCRGIVITLVTLAAPIDTARAGGLNALCRLPEGLDVKLVLTPEFRGFPESPRFPDQDAVNLSFSLDGTAEYLWNERRQQFVVRPFFRLDQHDSERTHFDIREFKYLQAWGNLEFRIGIDKVFWGVTESVHLVDFINQDDAVEDVDGEDKLGQPMVSLGYSSGLGLFDIYILPGFRTRTFPGPEGRPRTAVPVLSDKAEFESGLGRAHVDLALRWSKTFGDWDVALSQFYGTNRDPDLRPRLLGSDDAVLIPFYNIVSRTGLEIQSALGPLLLKLEGLYQLDKEGSFVSYVAGFEYTFFDVAGSGADIGALFEHIFDDRGKITPSALENDYFFGARLALNDVAGTQLLTGLIWDTDDSTTLIRLESSRRLSSRLTLSIEAQFFSDAPSSSTLSQFSQDDFFQVRLEWYF